MPVDKADITSIAVRHQQLMENGEACHTVRDFIAHFSNPLRLRILCILSLKGASVNELVAATGARQPTVSQQLNLLRLSGIVSRTRMGNRSHYELADPIAREMMDFIMILAEKLVLRQADDLSRGAI